MELKKNPKLDINREKGLYFVFGLFLILFFCYLALEWKTYVTDSEYDLASNQIHEELEEVPVEKFTVEQPKIKQVLPQEIKIEEDDIEIVETEILTTEVDSETEILKAEDIVVEKIDDDLSINFIVIEEVPIFPGCENEKDKRACFQKMMQKHIMKNFRYPELEQEMGIQGRVNVQFVIQKDGSIGDIKMRGPNENLEKEAARIISKLPKMIPGKQRGTPVKVPFSMPIIFRLQ